MSPVPTITGSLELGRIGGVIFATLGVLELGRVALGLFVAVDEGVAVGCISVVGVGGAVDIFKGKVGKGVGRVVGGG